MTRSKMGDATTRAALLGLGWWVAGPIGLGGVALGLGLRWAVKREG
jgi:hypothetical protein